MKPPEASDLEHLATSSTVVLDAAERSSIMAKLAAAGENRDLSIYTGHMDAALEAKAATILKYFPELREDSVIVDAGSGTGQLGELIAQELEERPKVFCLDLSHELLEIAQNGQALITPIFGDAREVNFPENTAHVIYSSTAGHEIESFGGPGSMTRFLQSSLETLEPGGTLIVRDFAKPSLPNRPIYMKIETTEGLSAPPRSTPPEAIDYSLLSPQALLERFQIEFNDGDQFSFQVVEIAGEEYIEILPEWAHEFYLRKDYTANWRNEIREKYTYWSEEEAQAALEAAGYTDVRVENDNSQWITDNRLKGKIELFQSDPEGLKPIDFPMTHLVMVGTKPGETTSTKTAKTDLPRTGYNQALESIQTTNQGIQIGSETFTASPLISGRKREVLALSDGKSVIKVANRENSMPHNVFKSILQIVERQDVLTAAEIPHLKVLDHDKSGPPYRYLIQERMPEDGILAAELIQTGQLSQEDSDQIKDIVATMEAGKTWQLDMSPFSWFRDQKEDGSTQMTYLSGRVYQYDERWEFEKIGLPQWLDPQYTTDSVHHEARIPALKKGH